MHDCRIHACVEQDLQLPELNRFACLMGALSVQVRAARLGPLVSDDDLFKVGVPDEAGDAAPNKQAQRQHLAQQPLTLSTDKRVWRQLLGQQPCCMVILDTANRAFAKLGTLDWHKLNRRAVKWCWGKLGWKAYMLQWCLDPFLFGALGSMYIT